MEDILQVLFKENKFLLIVGTCITITVVFFIAVDEFSRVIHNNRAVMLFSIVMFYSMFQIYVNYEVKNAKK